MEAIVLARRDIRETDQMISVLTKERGRLDLLARGVKKITSKNAPHLQPFSYGEITIEPGKDMQHLTRVQPIFAWPGIRKHAGKSLGAGFVASFISQVVAPEHPDARLFSLLRDWLFFIEKHEWDPLVVDAFVLKFFAYSGVAPILDQCVVSGVSYHDMVREELTAPRADGGGRKAGFYFAGGGLVSADMREQKERVGEEVYPCGLKEVSDMRLLLHGDWTAIVQAPLSQEDRALVHALALAYACYHSERKLADWRQVQGMVE